MSSLVEEQQEGAKSQNDYSQVDGERTRGESSRSTLERKRATDRKSQQAARARTKARITQLELQVTALTSAEGPRSLALLNQLQAQCAENNRLRNLLKNIHDLANIEADAPELGNSKESVGSAQPSAVPAQDEDVMEHPPPLGVTTCSQEQILLDSRPASLQEKRTSRKSGLECGEGARDYFKILNSAVCMMEACMQTNQIPSLEVDEDINIRAIIRGWDAVELQHELDIGWQIIRDVDQGLFHRSGLVERIAILRIMRSMLLVRLSDIVQSLKPTPPTVAQTSVDTLLPPERAPPSYMDRTQAQIDIPHVRLIDYFSWPVIRDFFILHGIDFAPENIVSQFAVDVGFRWPFGSNDTHKYRLSSGLYSFSHEFNEAYRMPDAWYFKSTVITSILPPFAHSSSSLQQQTEVHDSSSENRPPESGSTTAGTINDILNLGSRWMDTTMLSRET